MRKRVPIYSLLCLLVISVVSCSGYKEIRCNGATTKWSKVGFYRYNSFEVFYSLDGFFEENPFLYDCFKEDTLEFNKELTLTELGKVARGKLAEFIFLDSTYDLLNSTHTLLEYRLDRLRGGDRRMAEAIHRWHARKYDHFKQQMMKGRVEV